MLNAFIELFVHLVAWIGVNLSIKVDEMKNKDVLDFTKEMDAYIEKSWEDYEKRWEEDMRRKYGNYNSK